MARLTKIDLTQLSSVQDSHLIFRPTLAINRGVKVATAVGYILKQGVPYLIMENRIVRVLSGRFRVLVDLIEYELCDNEALYIGQKSVIEIIDYASETTVDILGFTLPVEDDNIRRVHRLGAESAEWMEGYFRLIYTLSCAQPFENRCVEHLLLSLHAHIVDNPHTENHGQTPHKRRSETLFHSLIELLNATSGKQKLPFYAARLNISPQYLSRLTMEVSGVAASEWINRAIILQAKLLLRDRQLTIEQIAEELNFSTLPYFCRFFSRETGLTPSQYRRSI